MRKILVTVSLLNLPVITKNLPFVSAFRLFSQFQGDQTSASIPLWKSRQSQQMHRVPSSKPPCCPKEPKTLLSSSTIPFFVYGPLQQPANMVVTLLQHLMKALSMTSWIRRTPQKFPPFSLVAAPHASGLVSIISESKIFIFESSSTRMTWWKHFVEFGTTRTSQHLQQLPRNPNRCNLWRTRLTRFLLHGLRTSIPHIYQSIFPPRC